MGLNNGNGMNQGGSIPKRMGAVTVAAGFLSLGIILLIAGFQFGRDVLLSLKDYNLFQGILGSPWAGLENYKSFFENSAGGGVVFNTLLYNTLFAVFCFFLSALGGAVICSFPKRSVIRDALAALAMLPVFVPGEVYATWLFDLFGSLPFTNASLARILIPFLASMKYAGIPVMLTHVLGILKKERDILLPVKCAGLFSLASMSLAGTGHFSIQFQLLNPLILKSADSLDTFSFRTGFQNMQVGIQAAAGVIQFLISLVFMALLFLPVKRLFQSAFRGEKEYTAFSFSVPLTGAGLALAAFILLYLLPYLLKGNLATFSGFQQIGPGTMDAIDSLPDGIAYLIPLSVSMRWLAVTLTASLLCTVISFTAGGFAGGGKTSRICGAGLLVLVTLLTAQPFTMGSYVTLRSLGVIDTYFAIIMATLFSSAAVWAFAAIRSDTVKPHFRGLVFGAVGIFLIQTALNYCYGTPSLLFLNRAGMAPMLVYRELMMALHSATNFAGRPALVGSLGVSGLMLSLPPVLVFLLAKGILPAESMLAVIAAGKKQ